MVKRLILVLGLSVIHGVASGQAAAKRPSFEVASVKPSGPTSVRNFGGGPGTDDPGRYTATRAHLLDLVFEAYDLKMYEQVSGPGWIDEEEYDVTAKVPPETSRRGFRTMLQNLLAERLRLQIHHETREFRVYELVVAKNGPKLKPAGEPHKGAPSTSQVRASRGQSALPPGEPDMVEVFGPDTCRLTAQQEPTSELASALSGPMAAGLKVIDKTGLTGKYDFALYYSWKATGGLEDAQDAPAPTLNQALQEQLGLKLVAGKAPFDVVVIDHAEKVPTEN
jgi:uncharacterized protein (TIGR03435 family)